MNHLAHALLADAGDIEFALGSAAGDFCHGHPDVAWPRARQAGLRFHRAIDRYTDAHPEVVAARCCFQPPMRRYAGIVLDVWFDHLLVLDWHRYAAGESPGQFSERWLTMLEAHAVELPASQRAFLTWMRSHGLPVAYADETTLDLVFHALARRLSHPSPIGAALPALHARADVVQAHFDAFFPDLAAHARGLCQRMLA